MSFELIEKLRDDCIAEGRGRKKWWADQLGIPPLTLSHWLVGRQKPNGENSFLIKNLLDQKERNKRLSVWREFIWDCYYTDQVVSIKILPTIILEILSSSELDSRTLALLSRYVEKNLPHFEAPESGELKNRLGWLLEVSGQKASFLPDKMLRVSSLLKISAKSAQLKRYLRRYQTPVGKKWHLYDCPLEELKKSLP